MSVCRDCGAEIDWIRKPDGGYIPVDPEPVFVIEGEGTERFYDDELGEITGRLARTEEIKDYFLARVNIAQSCGCLPIETAFVPHRRTCRMRR